MQINGISHVHQAQAINGPHRTMGAGQAAQPSRAMGVDQLDISHEADLVSRVRDVPEMRMDRIAEIRSAIEAGEYETDEKLDIALDRLLAEIG